MEPQNPGLVIQNLISDYKTTPIWKKILYFLPLLLVIAAIIVYIFFGKSGTILNSILTSHKNQVDNQLKDLDRKKDDITKQEEKLDAEIKQIVKEIEENENQANSINERIDNANSFDDLRNIQKELGSK